MKAMRWIGVATTSALVCFGAWACDERIRELPILEQAPTAIHESAPHALSQARSIEALTALNRGEIDLARYALGRARTEEARGLAQALIDAHTEAQAHVSAWAQTHGVTAEASGESATMETSARAIRTRLEYASDDDFDRAYAATQVEMHEDALDLLDGRVLLGARDADFHTMVTGIRDDVAAHLAQARLVVADLPSPSIATREL